MVSADVETSGDLKVLTATFDTLGGANLAVNKLEEMEKQGLLAIENTITVSKNAWDKIDVNETTGDSAKQGAGAGAIIGGVLGMIFPPSVLASAGLGAALGGMLGVLRGTNFDNSDIQAMADSLQPGQSMLIAFVTPEWQDEVAAALDGVATKVGWAALDGTAVSRVRDNMKSS